MKRLALILLLGGCSTAPSPQLEQASPPPTLISGKLAHDAIAFIPTRDKPVCAITKVVDGDTVHITCSKGGGPTRLTGFDTPETYQSGCAEEKRLGVQARNRLEKILRGAKLIAPRLQGRDKYNRVLVQLIVDGRDLADMMIEDGLAVRYTGGQRINWCAKLEA